MRCKSEETMEQIKNAVEEFYFSHYRSPSIGELAAEVGYAKSTVHSYLWEMDRRGLLSYNGKTAETSVTRKANAEVVLTPVLGSISCGQPEYAEEDFEAYVALPTALFGSGEFFLLRARGYSMVEALSLIHICSALLCECPGGHCAAGLRAADSYRDCRSADLGEKTALQILGAIHGAGRHLPGKSPGLNHPENLSGG